MPTYRVEEASTGRAGCKNKECQEKKEKILKGELRLGSWVETEAFQSWAWKHWGCVTPKQIEMMKEIVEDDDFSLLDGYDELSAENQEKIREAVAQGHVADSDWKGDVEVNRPGKTGFRVRVSKKKAAAADKKTTKPDDTGDKPKSAKRSKKKAEESEQEEVEPVSKKAKTTSKRRKVTKTPPKSEEEESAAEEEEEEEVPDKKKKGGPKPRAQEPGRRSSRIAANAGLPKEVSENGRKGTAKAKASTRSKAKAK